MEGLLKWSIAAQNGDKSKQPDPKALSELFGAPDDLTQMRAELTVALDSDDKNDRIEYLEKFEEHVENVDNANNIGEMWNPLVQLTSDSDDDVRALALSCVAAALQNNEKSQSDFLQIPGGIEKILFSVKSSNDTVSIKALFALSCAIAHCMAAYTEFTKNQGWALLGDLLRESFDTGLGSPKKKARALSLVYSIVLLLPQNEIYDHLERMHIQPKLEAYKSKESGLVNEKINDILNILKENPRAPVKLLN